MFLTCKALPVDYDGGYWSADLTLRSHHQRPVNDGTPGRRPVSESRPDDQTWSRALCQVVQTGDPWSNPNLKGYLASLATPDLWWRAFGPQAKAGGLCPRGNTLAVRPARWPAERCSWEQAALRFFHWLFLQVEFWPAKQFACECREPETHTQTTRHEFIFFIFK